MYNLRFFSPQALPTCTLEYIEPTRNVDFLNISYYDVCKHFFYSAQKQIPKDDEWIWEFFTSTYLHTNDKNMVVWAFLCSQNSIWMNHHHLPWWSSFRIRKVKIKVISTSSPTQPTLPLQDAGLTWAHIINACLIMSLLLTSSSSSPE